MNPVLSNYLRALFPIQHLLYLWDLLCELVSREMKVQYKRSAIGILWSLVTPLTQLLVFQFLFRLVLQLNIPRYSSFAFSGMLIWAWFQSSLVQGAGAITNSRELIRRPGFPAAILPVVAVTTNFVHFLLALPILLFFLGLGDGAFKPTMLLLPILMLLQFILSLSLSYLVATANVIFRDTQHILGVFLQMFFYVTPIFYDAKAVPEQYQWAYFLNPMAQLVESYRDVLLRGLSPNWGALFVLGLLAGGLLWVGYRVFIRVSDRFAEEL